MGLLREAEFPAIKGQHIYSHCPFGVQLWVIVSMQISFGWQSIFYSGHNLLHEFTKTRPCVHTTALKCYIFWQHRSQLSAPCNHINETSTSCLFITLLVSPQCLQKKSSNASNRLYEAAFIQKSNQPEPNWWKTYVTNRKRTPTFHLEQQISEMLTVN